MKLSIITVSYNSIDYIENCILNVASQKFPGLEHIIIDGASKDGTAGVILSYAQKYNHIKWISEPDSGQSDAMNKGIALATGEFISFLNVDDYYEEQAIQTVMKILTKNQDSNFIIGNCNIWNNANELIYINKPRKITPEYIIARKYLPVNPSAYFYNKNLHQKVGYYSTDEHQLMDIQFILRCGPILKPLYIDKILGNFRMIDGTKTMEKIKLGELENEKNMLFLEFFNNSKFTTKLKVRWLFIHTLLSKKIKGFQNIFKIAITDQK